MTTSQQDNRASEPTEGELRSIVVAHLRKVAPRYADDQENIRLRVRGTQRLARNYRASGLSPSAAWNQAIREKALSMPFD